MTVSPLWLRTECDAELGEVAIERELPAESKQATGQEGAAIVLTT
jgi:hypothetical protein